ncbi:hypothetical protein MMC07_009665 [Pseudocyphellaria aurata]|nr:hypothetical protein [Pseudocyphellaria aurata]
MAQINDDPDWITFLKSLEMFFSVLTSVPELWLNYGNQVIIDDPGQQQLIPTEAPLELVVQICLMVHDVDHHLRSPDAVQATLRDFAIADDFPTEDPDGFSICIFVPQSDSQHSLIVGSTVMYGITRYDNELRARFRNESYIDATAPEGRYKAVGYTRGAEGTVLASYEKLVKTRLIAECAGRTPAPAAGGQLSVVLSQADRKKWVPFSYPGEYARAYFAPIVFAGQPSWFYPTPRCLKCRVIHDYKIEAEDLKIKALPNRSCQCAEDIAYINKLRQLDRVGDVVLDDL